MNIACSNCLCIDFEIASHGAGDDYMAVILRCLGCGEICEIRSPWKYDTNKKSLSSERGIISQGQDDKGPCQNAGRR
jgi:hypothetical protein